MDKTRREFEITRVELDESTIVARRPVGDHPLDDPTMERLKTGFDSILEQKGIYYPVHYSFVRELGRGRQGVVFLGLRQGARGCVTRHAIKLFDPGIYRCAETYWTDMGRIAAQTSLLQTVHSPNLVGRDVYEETNGIGYIQMEAVDGTDLRSFLDGEQLKGARAQSSDKEWDRFKEIIFRETNEHLAIQPGVAIYIMRMMLRGLETLHSHGFVHSDIKPSNIMINRLGYVKLIDFGRAVRAGERMSILLGTPMYMAPETHRLEPNSVQSDIYSVGLVGLEMLRGSRIIDMSKNREENLLELKMHLHERLEEFIPDHVGENTQFMEILRRFLHPDPANRYPNARSAETDTEGLRQVHKQLTRMGKDSDYGRELEQYVSKLENPTANVRI